MKTKIFLVYLLLCFVIVDAAAQKRSNRRKHASAREVADSIVYVDTEIAIQQKAYLDLLSGDWNLTQMREQARMAPRQLNGINLVLRSDSTFSVFAACGTTNGKFSLKGTSIKFIMPAFNTNGKCDTDTQINLLLDLLQKRVSSYAVTAKSLILRDGSANTVFESVPSQ